ncbi:MAG: protein translocase subunit SecDF [Paludibacter sp.]|jgi:SecD/SecF fusion protein|nr:protein translocase subunit SecDF [Paludibacter sp.]
MQNKGLIRIFAIALSLVCIFYLSFSFVTSYYNSKAEKFADGDPMKEYQYLDSIANTKVWLGYTLKECREKEINLGLDLKGGMNVTLEISVPDIIRSLSGNNTSENFNKAITAASEAQKTNSQRQYLDLLIIEYQKLDPNVKLSSIFSTFELKEKISLNSTNDEVIKVLKGEIDGAISNSFNVLRTRIDRFGVVQPNIQRDNGNTGRILIELPGIKEPERVRKLLQGSANLEFWETYNVDEIAPNLQEANRVIAELNNSVNAAADTVSAASQVAEESKPLSSIDSLKAELGQAQQSATDSAKLYEQAAKNNPLFALINTNAAYKCVIGTVHSKDTAKVNAYLTLKQVQAVLPADLGFRWTVKPVEGTTENFALVAIKYPNIRDKRAPLAGNVITDARTEFSQTSSYASVSMTMNTEGAQVWARLTKDNINRAIAIALDGYIYSYPNVQNEITGGRSSISGTFSMEEANDLANTLKSGRMPAPARIVQEDVIGPSLGQETINNGFISFGVAFLLVLVFMIFYYGKVPGLIADISLFVNVFLLLGILASFSAALTLPGIAGIVLTLGMAVDGNVLIYERIREERMSGKTQKTAIKDGYKAALSAIIDANVTSFITGVILAIFGTGPVFGFAVTLIIGIITSFITSVFLTRLMLDMYASRETAKNLAFTTRFTETWFQNTKFDFIGKRKIGYIISGAVIVICLISLTTRGLSFGIDFSGGRNYIVRFDDKVDTEEVRSMLEDAFKDDTEEAGVKVISIGAENQVRISTKYKINDVSENAENQVIALMYNNLKPLLKENTTQEEFATVYIQSSQKVGPTVADDIKTAAIWAIFFSLLAVSIYIFIRFSDFSFSAGTMACLAHDVLIILGLYSLFYSIMPFSLEMDQEFIAAILTYIGYSVNDTVVIFDRIRENVRLFPKRDRKDIINESLNETLSRTFSTSTAVLLVMLAMFILGGETVRGFLFALVVGSVLGIYSTLFVAVPLAYDLMISRSKKKAAKAAALETKKK